MEREEKLFLSNTSKINFWMFSGDQKHKRKFLISFEYLMLFKKVFYPENERLKVSLKSILLAEDLMIS